MNARTDAASRPRSQCRARRNDITGECASPERYGELAFFLGSAGTRFAVAAAPDFTFACATIASAHGELLEIGERGEWLTATVRNRARTLMPPPWLRKSVSQYGVGLPATRQYGIWNIPESPATRGN